MYPNKCITCKLYIPQTQTCQIMIAQMRGKILPTDTCSQHKTYLAQCSICGVGLLNPIVESINGELKAFCEHCSGRL